MNWVNQIDEMPGPEFLGLYAMVIVATLSCCAIWRLFSDPTRDLDLPPLPEQLNPYAVAWLRGQESELIRVAVFRLLQLRYLELTGNSPSTRRIRRSDSPPEGSPTHPLERIVLSYCSKPRMLSAMFADLETQVQAVGSRFQKQFEEDSLFTTRSMRLSAAYSGLAGGVVILGLGGFKLIDAVNEGRSNVGFLLAFAVIGCVMLLLICLRHGLTNLGTRYLETLQTEFATLKNFDHARPLDAKSVKSEGFSPAGEAESIRSNGFVAMGLFGTSVLVGTQYSYFSDAFVKAAKNSGGTWVGGGGGCGGGCGGGGGGGGCGGGGCGGCGGG